MYPQLMNQASRLAPMLSRLTARGGSFATPFWKASQIDTPEVNATPVPPQVNKDQFGNVVPPPANRPGEDPALPPQARLDATFKALPEMAQNNNVPLPLDTMNWPFGPVGAPTQAPASAAAAGVPMPTARPAEAPQAPQEDTGFFMRNALMMQDPMGGGFIDPTGASSVSGPDLISKMMGYLQKKV